MMNEAAATAEANGSGDPVFTDEAAQAAAARDEMPEPKARRKKASSTDPTNISGRLFAATPEEAAAEDRRKHDHKIGLLIGPKNLVKLRAFGYDCKKISDELSSGVAHRGMNE